MQICTIFRASSHRFLCKHLSRNCHHIIASTEQEKRGLIKHYGSLSQRISVIPCGVNLDLFKPVNKKLAKQEIGLTGKKIILFVGRIEPLKGIDQLIRAIDYLQDINNIKPACDGQVKR